MVFLFEMRRGQDFRAVKSFVRAAEAGDLPLDGLARALFADLIREPPHMLSLEDMLFCQAIAQRALEGFPGAARISVRLAEAVDITDQDGLHAYWVPSSKADTLLRF